METSDPIAELADVIGQRLATLRDADLVSLDRVYGRAIAAKHGPRGYHEVLLQIWTLCDWERHRRSGDDPPPHLGTAVGGLVAAIRALPPDGVNAMTVMFAATATEHPSERVRRLHHDLAVMVAALHHPAPPMMS
jgi:hypothetical protein